MPEDYRPIESLSDYMRTCIRGPLAGLVWIKYALLLAIGVYGAVVMFGAEDTRSLVIGAALFLAGVLCAAAVSVGYWVVIGYDANARALRALRDRHGKD